MKTVFRPIKEVFFRVPHVTLPTKMMTNKDLVEWLNFDLKEDYIEVRTGIKKRYWVEKDECLSDLLARNLKEFHALTPDFLQNYSCYVLSTISGDYPSPPTAPIALQKAGLPSIGAFDLAAACAGFVSGLDVASKMALASDSNILLSAADIRSKFLNPSDLASSILFGDCSTTTVVSLQKSEGCFQLIASELRSEGAHADIISIEAGGSKLPYQHNTDESNVYLKMKSGPKLFLLAVDGMVRAAESILSQTSFSLDDIDWVVPHQANVHLLAKVGERLGVHSDKIVKVIEDFGNTSGTSIALALNQHQAKLKKGDKLLLLSAGAGGLAATAIVQYV